MLDRLIIRLLGITICCYLLLCIIALTMPIVRIFWAVAGVLK